MNMHSWTIWTWTIVLVSVAFSCNQVFVTRFGSFFSNLSLYYPQIFGARQQPGLVKALLLFEYFVLCQKLTHYRAPLSSIVLNQISPTHIRPVLSLFIYPVLEIVNLAIIFLMLLPPLNCGNRLLQVTMFLIFLHSGKLTTSNLPKLLSETPQLILLQLLICQIRAFI